MTYEVEPDTGGGGGPTGPDRFARRYLVGIGASYPAAPQAGPFRYVQDPGDGTGLQAVLAEAALAPGDIWIAPGVLDFNAGPIAGRLTVPPNVTVYGAGRGVTTVQGLTAGFVDQGVFVLQAGASLCDMSIVGGSAAPALGPSAALVELAGDGTRLARVDLDATTSGDGAPVLRGCVQVTASSPLQRFIVCDTVAARCNSPANAVGNVAPLLIESSDGSSSTLANRFACFGGNYGVRIVSGTLVADKLIVLGPRVAGVAGVPGSGAFRVDQSGIFHDPTTAGAKWIGIDVPAGGGWVLRSVSLQDAAPAPTYSWIGISLQDQAAAIDIDGCIVSGARVAITGPSLPNTGVFTVTIRACLLLAQSSAIVFRGPNNDACCVEDCIIDMAPDPLAGPCIAVSLSGNHWTVAGNRIRNQSPPGAGQLAQCLAMQAALSAVTGNVMQGSGTLPRVTLAAPSIAFVGNTVETTDPTDNQPAVDVLGTGCTVTGNVVTSPDQVTPIRVQAPLTAVTGNRVQTIPNTPGITLTAGCNNSTALGNVVETCAPAPQVLDLGAGNAVLGNAGT